VTDDDERLLGQTQGRPHPVEGIEGIEVGFCADPARRHHRATETQQVRHHHPSAESPSRSNAAPKLLPAAAIPCNNSTTGSPDPKVRTCRRPARLD